MFFLSWLLRCLESSGVKIDSHHDIFHIFSPPNYVDQVEYNITIPVDNSQDLPIDTPEEITVEDKTHFSFISQDKASCKNKSSISRLFAEETGK